MPSIRGLLRRFVLMLGGEVLQSAFHLGLNIGLVRVLDREDYGIFAIVFLAGGIGLSYVRSLAGVPASTFVPGRGGRRPGRAYEVTFGSGAVAVSGLIGAAVAMAVAFVPDVRALPAGAFVALWCLRSYIRIALFARRRPVEAGLGDLVFALAGTVLALWLARGETQTRLDGVFLALALAHALGIAASLMVLREPVRIDFGRWTRRRYHGLRRKLLWSLIGVTMTNLQVQGLTLILAFGAGPAAYAPIAAVLVLFAPLRLPTAVLVNLTQPEMAGLLGRGQVGAVRRLARNGAALAFGGSLAYGAILALAHPFIDSHLFGGRFEEEPLGLITALLWLVMSVAMTYAVPRALLEAVQDFRYLAALSGSAAAVGCLAVTALLVASTPAWSILGLLLSEVIVLAGCGVAAARLHPPVGAAVEPPPIDASAAR